MFLTPILILVVPLELLLRNIPNEYTFKSTYLREHGDSIHTLVLGNSHAYYGIDPNQLSFPGFNASHISQSIDLDLLLLRNHIEAMPNLKYLVIPMDYFTLFSRTATGNEPWRMKNYQIYHGLEVADNISNYSEVLSLPLGTNCIRLFSYYINQKSAIGCNELGYSNTPVKTSDLVKTGRQSAIRHTKTDRTYCKQSVQMIADMIDLASNKSIQVIIITYPVYQSYQDHLDKSQLKTTIETATQFAVDNPWVTYLNMLTDQRFGSADFRDGDHLNHIGATKLTKILDEQLLEM